MSDAQEIESLMSDAQFEASLHQYSDVQREWIGDLNNGNYASGNLLFDTLSVRDRWWIPSESYLTVPLRVTMGSGTNTSLVAFKRAVTDLIYSVQVQSSSGNVIVSDTNLPLYNHVRSLLNLSFEDLQQMAPELHFAKDTENQYHAAFDVANNQPTNNALNPGFVTRARYLKQGATYTGASKTIDTVVNIPLRFIHPLFEACNFPLINQRFQLTFGLNIGPNGSTVIPLLGGSANSISVGLASDVPAGAAAGVAASGILTPPSTAAGALALTIPSSGVKAPGSSVTITQARLNIKCVKFSPELNLKLAQKLQSGMVKMVDFVQCDTYLGSGASEVNVAANNGTQLVRLVSPSTIRPTRVFMVGMPNGAWTDASVLSTYIASFTNCNILISNQRYYNNDLTTPREQYEILKDNMVYNGLISYQEFLASYRILCFDLTRHKDFTKAENQAVSIATQTTRANDGGGAADYAWLVEHANKVSFHMSSTDCKIVVGLSQ